MSDRRTSLDATLRAEILGRLVEASPVGCVVWRLTDAADDASLELVVANDAASRFLSRDLSADIGRRFVDVFPNLPPERRQVYAQVARGGAPYQATVESTVTGVLETFAVHALPLDDGCVGVYFENLGAQRRAETEARQAHRFLDSIVEHLPNMVFVKDAEHLRFQRFNKAGEELLGMSRDQLLGKSDYDFFPKEQAEFFIAADRRTIEKGVVLDIPEEPIQTMTGERWLHTRKVPILDVDGSPRFLLGISEDITERRQADAALRAAKDSAEAAQQELETFSYSVAHDLRAPLRAIDGFSLALLEDHGDRLEQDAADYLDRIRRATRRMSELIDDLLQLSQVTRSELHRGEIDLSELARHVCADLSAAHPDRDVETVVQDGVVAMADARLLRNVLENLLGNAFKFTSRRPRARIEFGSTTGSDERPVYFVRDDGVGFDMAHAKKLFYAFERLHPKDFEGTGIGLAIVQRVVLRHGGRAWAESKPGGGATFYFTLGRPT